MGAARCYLDKVWLKNYQAGVPEKVAIPDFPVHGLFDRAAEAFPRRTALNFCGAKLSYRLLGQKVDRFAAGLIRLGVHKGDRVALCLATTPQFLIAYFGALKAGATVVPVNPLQPSADMAFILEEGRTACVVCQDLFYPTLERSGANPAELVVAGIHEYLPAWKKIGVRKARVPERPALYRFHEVLRLGSARPSWADLDPERDFSLLAYTSGATGRPRGVLLTHRNLMACVWQLRAFFPALEEGREVVAVFLPLHQIYSQTAIMLLGLSLGATLVLFTSMDVDRILPSLERHRVTVFPGVPALYEALNQHPRTRWVDWKRMKLLLSGAEPLPEPIARAWEERTGQPILEGFGMTESSGVSHVTPPHRIRRGSFGVPLPGEDAAVLDPSSMEFVPVGEIGELFLSGPNVSAGYWQREHDEKAFVVAHGRRWFRTGDLVRMDEAGYFYYYDRVQGLVHYKGSTVLLREVEEALGQHPMVRAAGVVAVKDREEVQSLKAHVVLHPEARGEVSGQDLLAFLRERLPPCKIPEAVEFRSELPLTPGGQVLRQELEEKVRGG